MKPPRSPERGGEPRLEAASRASRVQIDNRHTHGQVEEDHGGDPRQRLRAARPAAIPTHELPTTQSTCVSTRSRRRSWRWRLASGVDELKACAGYGRIEKRKSESFSCVLFEKAQTVRLQSMRKMGLRSTGMAAALSAVAMSCCVASAQMGEMPGMHHHHAPDGEKLGSVLFRCPASPHRRRRWSAELRCCTSFWLRRGGATVYGAD